MHFRANPLPIYFPMSFEGQGNVEKRKVYVQSFRSLALVLHTERENLLKTPRTNGGVGQPIQKQLGRSLMIC